MGLSCLNKGWNLKKNPETAYFYDTNSHLKKTKANEKAVMWLHALNFKIRQKGINLNFIEMR